MDHDPPLQGGAASGDRRSVVIRMGSLGDVALTTGVLEYWRHTRGMRCTFITKECFAPLLAHHPAVEETIGVGPRAAQGLGWMALAHRLARGSEGRLLIDVNGSFRSRVLAALWRGSRTRYPRYSVERRRYLQSHSARLRSVLLSADIPQRYAMALDRPPPPRAALRPRVFLVPDEIENARRLLTDRGIGSPLAILHPYATHPLKTWPRQTWIDMAGALRREGWQWVVVGRHSQPFLGGVDARCDLTNETDLRTTCALLTCATVLLTADSGPMHLAEAVGTPVVSLFGPTTREWGFYPGGPRDTVLELPLPCRPCSLHGRARSACGQECLRGITPRAVMERLEALRA